MGGGAGGVLVDHFWAEPVVGSAVGFYDDGDCEVEAAGRCAQVESTGGSDVLVIATYSHGFAAPPPATVLSFRTE